VINDYKTVLVKIITLLWRESLLKHSVSSKSLVQTTLGYIKSQENLLGASSVDIVSKLKEAAVKLMNSGQTSETADVDDFMQSMRILCDVDSSTYEAIDQALRQNLDDQRLKRSMATLTAYLKGVNRAHQMSEIVKSANKEFNYTQKVTDTSVFARSLMEQLEPFSSGSGEKDPAIIGELDLSDNDKINETMQVAQARESGTSGLKTGWQDFNTALKGCLRRGYSYMVNALQHNHKTGFCLSVVSDILTYNTPEMIDVTKKPMVLFISCEDETADNIAYIYKRLKESELKEEIDVSKQNIKEMSAYVQEKLSVNGYSVRFVRINPSNWTYLDFQNYILELESEGYEIHCCYIDYLNLLSKFGCTTGASGDDIRDIFRRMRNFFSVRGTTFITPHQLSTEAKMLVRDGRQDLVKQVSQKGYTDGCKRIDQDIDGEITLHIEKIGDKSYLTVMVGKHRKVFVTEPQRYLVIPFLPYGPLPSDLNGPKITSRKIGETPSDAPAENKESFFIF
jgi:hypothetical protein